MPLEAKRSAKTGNIHLVCPNYPSCRKPAEFPKPSVPAGHHEMQMAA
jgi:ssDNA-binding Zn-finger/Zn-ribbon topoisomerase 1